MAFRASTVRATAGGTGLLVGDKPTGTVQNDVMLAWVVQDVGGTWTPPSGWTVVTKDGGGNCEHTGGPDGQYSGVYYKVAGSSEPTTYTWTGTDTHRGMVIIGSWSGRSTSSPISAATINFDDTTNSSPITVSATGVTAGTGDDLAWFAQEDQIQAATTWVHTAPSGYTKQSESSNGDWITVVVCQKDNASSGATGTVSGTATAAGATAGWSTSLIALRSSSGTVTSGAASIVSSATLTPVGSGMFPAALSTTAAATATLTGATLKFWRVPTSATVGASVHVIVFTGTSPTYTILAQGTSTIDASGFAQVVGTGNSGDKAFAMVHNYSDNTATTSIFGGPGIATVP